MHVKSNKTACFVLITLILSIGFIACSGGEDDPEEKNYRSKLIVEHGIQPVWVDDDNFLFCYDSDEAVPGVFLSDLDGSVTMLFSGIHNYDYVVSENGQNIAFTVPTTQNASLVLFNREAETLWQLDYEGSSPSFIGNDTLLYSAPGGQIYRAELNWTTFDPEPILFGYAAKASRDGQRIAYLNNGQSGQVLRVATYPDLVDFLNLDSYIGNDFIWRGNTGKILASKLDPDDLGTPSVYSYAIQTSPNSALMLSNAYRPSVSDDGNHLFANRATGQEVTGIYYKNLDRGTTQAIPNFMNPVAAAEDPICLAQNNTGIYLITIE